MMKMIENPFFKVWEEENGIIYSEIKRGSVLNGEEAIILVDAISKITEGQRRPVYTDISEIKSVDRAAMEYAISQKALDCVLALALIINSPIARVIGSLFLRIRKIPYPTKLFNSRIEAENWLVGILHESEEKENSF